MTVAAVAAEVVSDFVGVEIGNSVYELVTLLVYAVIFRTCIVLPMQLFSSASVCNHIQALFYFAHAVILSLDYSASICSCFQKLYYSVRKCSCFQKLYYSVRICSCFQKLYHSAIVFSYIQKLYRLLVMIDVCC